MARYAEIHDDEELRLLQRSLPYVVKNGVAGSTFNKYESAWDKWLRWSDTKHISGRARGALLCSYIFQPPTVYTSQQGMSHRGFLWRTVGSSYCRFGITHREPASQVGLRRCDTDACGPTWKKGPHTGRDHSGLGGKILHKNATLMDLRL